MMIKQVMDRAREISAIILESAILFFFGAPMPATTSNSGTLVEPAPHFAKSSD
jgi:hypothetical protein